MKRVLLILSFIIFSVVSFSQEGFVKNYSELITAGNLKDRLIVIAGAEMEGRATATEGQRRAARYIESEMKSIGLEPAKGRDYQVIFPLFQDSVVHISMAVNGKPLVLNDDFSAKANNSPARQLFSEVLYIDFDDTDWKNEKINVAGKLAMILANEQKGGDAVAAFNAQVASLQKSEQPLFSSSKSGTRSKPRSRH